MKWQNYLTHARKGIGLIEIGIGLVVSTVAIYFVYSVAVGVFAKNQVSTFVTAMGIAEAEVRSLSQKTAGFGTSSYMDRLRKSKSIPSSYYTDAGGGSYTYSAPICEGGFDITGANSGANFTVTCQDVPTAHCVQLISRQVFADTTTLTVGGSTIDLTDDDNSGACSTTQADNDFVWTIS